MVSIKCKVDDLGRITIPVQYRNFLGIVPHDRLDVEMNENALIVRKMTEKDILKSKLDDVMQAVGECKEIDPGEVATLVNILSKLVKENE